jgi:hypothetical protein
MRKADNFVSGRPLGVKIETVLTSRRPGIVSCRSDRRLAADAPLLGMQDLRWNCRTASVSNFFCRTRRRSGLKMFFINENEARTNSLKMERLKIWRRLWPIETYVLVAD